jgi:hypothetical protein
MLADNIDAFTAIKSPGLRQRCGLDHRPSTETHPGMTIRTFLA